jgi:hypothetical protein
MRRLFLGTLIEMVWVVLVLAAVSWLVVILISEQERGQSLSVSSRLSAGLLTLRKELPQLGSFASSWSRKALGWLSGGIRVAAEVVRGSAREAVERARASRRPAPMSFGMRRARSRGAASDRSIRSDGWRSRLVALIELILFVVLMSALFAGAIAAAALRIGHLGGA